MHMSALARIIPFTTFPHPLVQLFDMCMLRWIHKMREKSRKVMGYQRMCCCHALEFSFPAPSPLSLAFPAFTCVHVKMHVRRGSNAQELNIIANMCDVISRIYTIPAAICLCRAFILFVRASRRCHLIFLSFLLSFSPLIFFLIFLPLVFPISCAQGFFRTHTRANTLTRWKKGFQ